MTSLRFSADIITLGHVSYTLLSHSPQTWSPQIFYSENPHSGILCNMSPEDTLYVYNPLRHSPHIHTTQTIFSKTFPSDTLFRCVLLRDIFLRHVSSHTLPRYVPLKCSSQTLSYIFPSDTFLLWPPLDTLLRYIPLIFIPLRYVFFKTFLWHSL